MIFAICIDAGAGQKGYLEFYTWGTPGAFASYLIQSKGALAKFIGFWSVLIQAGFSYQGTELVGITAGETENPRQNVPAAIRKPHWRILFFFIGTIFFIGLLVPYDNKDLLSTASDATASPFVILQSLPASQSYPVSSTPSSSPSSSQPQTQMSTLEVVSSSVSQTAAQLLPS